MTVNVDMLLEEARLQSKEHPSKDARFFAKSVYACLQELVETIDNLQTANELLQENVAALTLVKSDKL